MLVDGDEVIHDSKRILQYLDWKYGTTEDGSAAQGRIRAAGRAIQSEAMETPEAAINAHRRRGREAQGAAREPARTTDQALRVAVRGGGCSGFQYALALDQRKDDDHVFEHDGVSVVVDKVSMQFVFGSEVDYVEGLQGAGFAVNNPNVVAACGCGSSFQVKEDAAEQAAASV